MHFIPIPPLLDCHFILHVQLVSIAQRAQKEGHEWIDEKDFLIIEPFSFNLHHFFVFQRGQELKDPPQFGLSRQHCRPVVSEKVLPLRLVRSNLCSHLRGDWNNYKWTWSYVFEDILPLIQADAFVCLFRENWQRSTDLIQQCPDQKNSQVTKNRVPNTKWKTHMTIRNFRT